MIVKLITILTLSTCLASTAFAQTSKKPLRAAGRVDAVSSDSITIVLPGNQKITLGVEKTTKVIGRGLGTRSRTMNQQGREVMITDLVQPSDSVVVAYEDAGGGRLLAAEVHVRLISK